MPHLDTEPLNSAMRDEHIDIDLENTYSKNENTDLGNSDPQNTKHKTQNTTHNLPIRRMGAEPHPHKNAPKRD